MDNTKAEAYLYDRLEEMCDEKVMLITKLNKIQIEIEETDAKIDQISREVDTAFEVFSPRPKKNDFAKQEIERLLTRKEELKVLFSDFSEQCVNVEEDIKQIKEALGEDPDDYEEMYVREEKEETSKKISGIQILESQENERSRIARDLHDSVVQVLTNLVHKSEICTKIVDVDTIRAKLELEIMAKTLRETISEMRNIIYDLRPMSFDDLGLDVTLDRAIKNIEVNTDMKVSLKIEGESKQLSNIVQLTILRIVQEGANNSIKYSKGNHLDIRLRYGVSEIYLEIEDDGQGFEHTGEASVNLKSGLGLGMMRERIELLSGEMEIDTGVGKGTKVKVRIPVQ